MKMINNVFKGLINLNDCKQFFSNQFIQNLFWGFEFAEYTNGYMDHENSKQILKKVKDMDKFELLVNQYLPDGKTFFQ